MSKTLKNYILFTFLIILIFNFSGCTIVEKIEEKLGLKNDYFEYLNNSYVPIRFLSEMYKDDRISANFAAVIYNIFHSNITPQLNC